MMQEVRYNTGNISKYKTGNPLKRKLIKRFDLRLLQLLQYAAEKDCSKQNQNLNLLDAGCGEGFVTVQIKSRRPDWHVVGIDGAEEAIALAKQLHTEIDFRIGNLYGLDFPDKVFDVVLCSEVLEHLEQPEKALKELQRVSKSVLLLTVPHEPWFRLGNLISLHNVMRLGNPVDHINHWGFSGFRQFTTGILDDFSCEYETSFPWSICLAVRKKFLLE